MALRLRVLAAATGAVCFTAGPAAALGEEGVTPPPAVPAAPASTPPAADPAPKEEPPPASPTPLSRALVLFKEKKYAQAVPLLEQAAAAPETRSDAVLLLGICRYRTGDLSGAEAPLREAMGSADPEARSAAQLFLGLVFDELGATDQAQSELGQALRSQSLGASAQRLLLSRRPSRIQISLLLAPEYDGNVPLTSYADWSANPAASADSDILFLGTVSLRPFRVGLSLGTTLSYRLQIHLGAYSLLLSSTWLGYSYAGRSDRVRATATVNYARLGPSPLFLEFDGRASYRRRLRSLLGLSVGYEFRYRDYASSEAPTTTSSSGTTEPVTSPNYYQPLSGQTHIGQLELGWGTAPEPLFLSVGYQVVRDQLMAPLPPLLPEDDFRAFAHGPVLRTRARLHPRLELALTGTFLHRIFDYVPAAGTEAGLGRIDHSLSVDTTLTVRISSQFEAFFGGSVLYNHSNRAAFDYLKPTGYLGLAAYFGLL
ncbi:MAG: hypothetical protein U1A78_24545 [Polyangia bacterium]